MKKIENKAFLKLGVVAMLLILGMTLVEAMALDSMVTPTATWTFAGGGEVTVTDPNGTAKITVWNTTSHVKMENLDLEKFSPTTFTFTVPPGNLTICLKDEEKPPATDAWIVNDTAPNFFGPFPGHGLCSPPKHEDKPKKK
jgi:hypothetical protein